MAEPAVLSLVWDLMRGGTEGQCARVAMELGRRGQTHRVAVFRRSGFFLEDVEVVCGPVQTLDIHRRFSPHTELELVRLAKWMRAEQIGILHAWDADAAIFGRRLARYAGARLITSRRDMAEIYPDWKLKAMVAADRQAARIVCNAQAIAKKVVPADVPADRVQVIPNLLDLNEFDELVNDDPPWTRPQDGRPVLVCVCRLDPEKDVGLLLRAHAAIPESERPVLVIAGDGEERATLEQQAADTVVFLGEVHGIPALLQQADIGVLCPRSNEGLSNSVLEMMAAGLPCVVTNCGGNGELISDLTGRVVPVGDQNALSAAILEVLSLSDQGAAMGAAGRTRIESIHDPATVADRFAGVYREAVQA